MASYNKVILMGRLTADPELRRTGSGKAVTSFNIAVDRQTKEKQTDFPDIVAWEGTAEFVARNFYKGKEILLEGDLQTRTYTDKDGNKRKVTEVVAREIRFVGKKEDGQQPQQQAQNNAGDYAMLDDDDEQLPF